MVTSTLIKAQKPDPHWVCGKLTSFNLWEKKPPPGWVLQFFTFLFEKYLLFSLQTKISQTEQYLSKDFAHGGQWGDKLPPVIKYHLCWRYISVIVYNQWHEPWPQVVQRNIDGRKFIIKAQTPKRTPFNLTVILWPAWQFPKFSPAPIFPQGDDGSFCKARALSVWSNLLSRSCPAACCQRWTL